MRPLAGMTLAVALLAQQAPNKLEFDVVSIKPADPAAEGRRVEGGRGGYHAQNLRLFELIMSAWHLNRDQIIGGPNWLETAGWDIDAKFPAERSAAQVREMMQAMLADRFRLVTHRDTRMLSVYALHVAKGGIKLKKGDGTNTMSAGPRMIRYNSGAMAELASQLSGYLGRHVLDRTDVSGQYAINLSFAPVDPGTEAVQDSAPSIFQALQEQAGLKLESTKGTVEVLVIDRAERPSPN